MQTLLVEEKGEIVWVRFHRPEVRNAVNLLMMSELEQLTEQWINEQKVKVVIFCGNERAFVSGGDLEEFHKREKKEEIFPVMRRMGKLLTKWEEMNVITIALVEGAAVGGGCEIATSCDFCFASKSATFGMIQVKLGITTGWGGATRLMHKIGVPRALDLLLTGKRITAEKAYEIGLVDYLVAKDIYQEVEDYAKQLSNAPHKAIKAYKAIAKMVKKGALSSDLFELEADSCAILWETEEHRQAVEEFLQRTRKK